jgi:fumarate reductase subunit C
MDRNIGVVIIILGIIAIVVGLLVTTGALSWFGRLPGDVRIKGERIQLYFPIVSMLIVSVVLTIALNLIRRLF